MPSSAVNSPTTPTPAPVCVTTWECFFEDRRVSSDLPLPDEESLGDVRLEVTELVGPVEEGVRVALQRLRERAAAGLGARRAGRGTAGRGGPSGRQPGCRLAQPGGERVRERCGVSLRREMVADQPSDPGVDARPVDLRERDLRVERVFVTRVQQRPR